MTSEQTLLGGKPLCRNLKGGPCFWTNKRFSQFSQTVVLLQQEGFLMGIGFIATGNWTGH